MKYVRITYHEYLAMCVRIHDFLCLLPTASPACRKGMCWLATLYLQGAGLIAPKWSMYYRIAVKFGGGKFGEFGEFVSNSLLIRQTFFCQMLERSQFAKLSLCQTFLLYGNLFSCLYHFSFHHQ